MWEHHQENPKKNGGAPEFWCPGTRTLVPFPAENRFFVLISRMGIRNINFSFFLSVFMCSWHFLVLLKHCQHKCENTIKKTRKKMWGHQSSGARAPELWCPLCNWLAEKLVFSDKTLACSIDCAPKHIFKWNTNLISRNIANMKLWNTTTSLIFCR